MFVDTSVVVAILSGEPDASLWAERLEQASVKITSPLVVLEAAMRMSTKLAIDPVEVEVAISRLLDEAEIEIIAIEPSDGKLAGKAFADYGKGRGHPAQLNLADCLSYACARNRGLPLLYKGSDFARTDLA
jgi:ribonuclease VapC